MPPKNSFFYQEFLLATSNAQQYIDNANKVLEYLNNNLDYCKKLSKTLIEIQETGHSFFSISNNILYSNQCSQVIDKRMEILSLLNHSIVFFHYSVDNHTSYENFVVSFCQQGDFSNPQFVENLSYLLRHPGNNRLFNSKDNTQFLFRALLLKLDRKKKIQFLQFLFQHICVNTFQDYLNNAFIIGPIFLTNKKTYESFKNWANIKIKEEDYLSVIKSFSYNIENYHLCLKKLYKFQKYEGISDTTMIKCLTQSKYAFIHENDNISKYISFLEKEKLQKTLLTEKGSIKKQYKI